MKMHLTIILYLCYYNQALFGELAEWFKALVLKTSDPVRDRGFESLILRRSVMTPQ